MVNSKLAHHVHIKLISEIFLVTTCDSCVLVVICATYVDLDVGSPAVMGWGESGATMESLTLPYQSKMRERRECFLEFRD